MEQAQETNDEVLARILLEWSRTRSGLLRSWTFQAIRDSITIGPNMLEEYDLGAQIRAFEEIFSKYPALATNRILASAREKVDREYQAICADNRLRQAINTGESPPSSYPAGRVTDNQKSQRRPRLFTMRRQPTA